MERCSQVPDFRKSRETRARGRGSCPQRQGSPEREVAAEEASARARAHAQWPCCAIDRRSACPLARARRQRLQKGLERFPRMERAASRRSDAFTSQFSPLFCLLRNAATTILLHLSAETTCFSTNPFKSDTIDSPQTRLPVHADYTSGYVAAPCKSSSTRLPTLFFLYCHSK